MQEKNLGNDMGIHSFKIMGSHFNEKCFPSLNDLLHEAERHPMSYNRMKRQFQYIAINSIRMGLKGWKPKGVVVPHYIFGEPSKGRKRDYDNIVAAARKIINDALVETKTIKDDSPKYLEYGTNEFRYGDKVFIEVILEEKDGQGLD